MVSPYPFILSKWWGGGYWWGGESWGMGTERFGGSRAAVFLFPFLNKGPVLIDYRKVRIPGFLFHYMTSRFPNFYKGAGWDHQGQEWDWKKKTSIREQDEITKDKSETEKSRLDLWRLAITEISRAEKVTKGNLGGIHQESIRSWKPMEGVLGGSAKGQGLLSHQAFYLRNTFIPLAAQKSLVILLRKFRDMMNRRLMRVYWDWDSWCGHYTHFFHSKTHFPPLPLQHLYISGDILYGSQGCLPAFRWSNGFGKLVKALGICGYSLGRILSTIYDLSWALGPDSTTVCWFLSKIPIFSCELKSLWKAWDCKAALNSSIIRYQKLLMADNDNEDYANAQISNSRL